VLDLERGVPTQDLSEPVVLVLVDEQDPEGAVCLALERAEQAFELVDSVDGRDHEIE
jgi:hypothetical protein